MARRTKAEAEQTRQKILKAALDLFTEKGYERTTFEDVAERIQLTKGAVYWHFKSKPDLFAELVADMTAKHNDQVTRVLPSPVSLQGLTAHFVERARLILGKPVNRKYFQMMMSLDWPAAKFMPVKRRLRQMESGPFVIIETTLAALKKTGEVRPDTDIATVTAVLGAVWLGLMKLQIDQCLELDFQKAIRFGFSTVLDAIRA
ncbi:MAG: TetR family transcriptional regulator [bacterium]